MEYSNYDKVGNRKNMKIGDVNTVYLYDEIYRLVYVDYDDGNSMDYLYDCLDNWVEKDDGSTPILYLHNELNQYTQVGPSGSQVTYTYDDNGNLAYDGQFTYEYDCENRLTQVKQGETIIATYGYDFLGRRISKTLHASQTTLHYIYDGSQVVAEYENGSLARKFVYGPGIDEPICMITDSGTYYYHFDGLGSVVALTNSSGTIAEKYSYDVYGNITATEVTEATDNPYYFTGRRLDEETGLYYYRARMYSLTIGRFLQPDPIGYADSLNLYQYCHNNPVMWVDPWGLLSRAMIKNKMAYVFYKTAEFSYTRLDEFSNYPGPYCTNPMLDEPLSRLSMFVSIFGKRYGGWDELAYLAGKKASEKDCAYKKAKAKDEEEEYQRQTANKTAIEDMQNNPERFIRRLYGYPVP